MLDVRYLRNDAGVRGATFDICCGEVFGLGGVLGWTHRDRAGAVRRRRKHRWRVRWRGESVFPCAPEAIAAGFALLPENPKFDGPFSNSAARKPYVRRAREARRGRTHFAAARSGSGVQLIGDLAIMPAAEFKDVGHLSAVQQKIVIGRWLFAEAALSILDEPRGIDVGAKTSVYRLINCLTASGESVISFPRTTRSCSRCSTALASSVTAVSSRSAKPRLAEGDLSARRRAKPRGRHERLVGAEILGPLIAMLLVAALVAATTPSFADLAT